MELTKFGHACTRLERDGHRLVIDPGTLTPEDAIAGAEAVLVTHEHFDHLDEQRLRDAVAADRSLQIWTNGSVAARLEGLGGAVHVVGAGDAFSAAGFEVTVHGEWHAEIHRDIPRIGNIGFIIDERVFHPGDALTVPEVPVETLLLPIHAPWSRVADLIDWVRAVAPARAVAVHDGALNEVGLGMLDTLLGEKGPGTGAPYTRLQPPASMRLD